MSFWAQLKFMITDFFASGPSAPADNSTMKSLRDASHTSGIARVARTPDSKALKMTAEANDRYNASFKS